MAILIDQVTKWWAQETLSNGKVIALLPTLEFDLVYNSGFSFSTGFGHGQWVALLVILVCALLIWQLHKATTMASTVTIAIVLGGAIGNLADRVFRADDGPLSGEVIDFIDVTWYAVFNLADILVVCGCIAYAVVETLRIRQAGPDDNTGLSDDPLRAPSSDVEAS